MTHKVQIESFKVFRDLVDTESFSKAATLNDVTQSAVSQQIRTLEEKFGVALVERTSKKFCLTQEGELFNEVSRNMVSMYEGLHHQFEEMRNVVKGTIRIATVYSIGLHELPNYIRVFMQQFPQVNVHVEYRRSNQVYEDVLQGVVDLGLVAFPSERKNLVTLPFREDRLVAICAPAHALARQGSTSLAEVAQHKFIGFEPDIPTRKAIDRIFREAGLNLHLAMEFDNIETVKRAVEIDAGISIVPLATVTREIRDGSLHVVELEGGTYTRPLGILHRQGRILSSAMKKFLKILREQSA